MKMPEEVENNFLENLIKKQRSKENILRTFAKF